MSKSDEASFSWFITAGLISATVAYVVHTYGCNWVALHAPWLLNILGEPITCILVGMIPFLFSYWSLRDPESVVAFSLMLLAPVCVCGALGYWWFNSPLLFGASALGALVVIFHKIGSKEATKNWEANAKAPPLASDPDRGKAAGRLIAGAVGIALSSPHPQ